MTVFVEVTGQGPNLVLLHGWAMHGGVFAELRNMLSAYYRVFNIDLPGHGRSGNAESMSSLEQLSAAVKPHVPSDAIVVGWSLGGLVTLKLAQQMSLRALVLISTTPRFVADDSWPHGMAPAVFAQFFSRLQQNMNATVDDFLRLQVRGDSDAAATFKSLQSSLLEHPAKSQALQLGLGILRDADERNHLASIDVPALVVAGEYDRITHPNAAESLAQQLRHARYALIKRAGHAAFISHREEFVNELQEFLAGIDAAHKVSANA